MRLTPRVSRGSLRRYLRRRRYRKRRRYRRGVRKTRVLKSATSTPFPRTLSVPFKYGFQGTINQATAPYTYRLNSLHDFELAAGGGQPRYFDTLCGANNTCAPYFQYRVNAAKINIKFHAVNASQGSIRHNDAFYVVATVHLPITTLPSSLSEALERSDCKVISFNSFDSGSKSTHTYSRFTRIAPWYGNSSTKQSRNFTAAHNANPAHELRLSIQTFTVTDNPQFEVEFAGVSTMYSTLFEKSDTTDS